jgi:hypothetical protein
MRLILIPALLLSGLAGCGSAGAHPATATTPSTATATQILAIGQAYARCLRDHGVPDFPDPQVSGGHLVLGGINDDSAKQALQVNQDAAAACQSILDQLPPSALKAQATFSAADLQQLLQFAQCVRQHGVPDWPDPKADGSFPIDGTPLYAQRKSDRVHAAFDQCRQYWGGEIIGS